MKTRLRFIFILLVGFQHYSGFGQELYISKAYSDVEQKDIFRIIEFVKSQILDDCEYGEQLCYEEYFNSLKDSISLRISFDEQLELFNSLDSIVFNDIWYSYSLKGNLDGVEYIGNTVTINIHGRFADILRQIPETNDQLEIYSELFDEMYGYSFDMNCILPRHANERFNYRSDDELFLIAVHLLTLNYEIHHVAVKPVPNKH